jgi:hypothetical protein
MFNQDGSASRDCSAEARHKIDTNRLRQMTEAEFKLFPTGAIADEIVYRLQSMGLDVDELSIRPRVTELKLAGVLLETGERRRNAKGNSCSVLMHLQFQGAV